MRLIDADNMRKATKGMFIYQDEFEDDTQHIAFEAYTKEDIENERTVEAIPIEWIKNWFNPKYANTVYYSLLRDMIKDWEKENAERENSSSEL